MIKQEGNTGIATRGQSALEPLKKALSAESVREQFNNALKENSGSFVASIIDLVGSDRNLQQCEPGLVIMECLKAATLKLPINKQLGQAWVVPYKRGKDGPSIPQFQIGYKGYIQLAMRTGQYKSLNAGTIFEGIEVNEDLLTGKITLTGKAKSEKIQGYFSFMELTNGFQKTVYMSAAEVLAHAKRFSRSYGASGSAWSSDFDAMAIKTVLLKLLRTYGVLSIEMAKVLSSNDEDDLRQEMDEKANKEVIDVPAKQISGGSGGAAKPEEGKESGPGF
ncbi:MAG: recombinase RecT [Sphaerochaeta sp.]|jgi:recombination protein RecT|nr:recombinase RecT [Sphaerochaeta sp.]